MTLVFSTVYADELRIPVMVGQTGGAASFGKPELDAYTLAVEEWNAAGGVNGQKIVLQVEDTQTNQRQVLSGFQLLAMDKPAVILGPTWLDTYQAVIPLAKQKNILLVTPSASVESLTADNRDWAVTFYHNSTLEIAELAKGLKTRGLQKVAVIYEQEPFAEMIHRLILKEIPDVVADLGTQGGETDFNALLLKLKQKAPDVLIVFLWDEKSLSALLKQVRIQLPDLKLATVHDGESWLKNPAFRVALPQLIYSKFLIKDPDFADNFERRFGYQPLLTASNAYDAMNAVLTARQAGHGTANEIRDYLLNHSLKTVTFGEFKFTADGDVPSEVAVIDFPEIAK